MGYKNSGQIGQYNYGVYGTRSFGSGQDVIGYDPQLAREATLTDIKGAGWTNQTLAKIVTDIAAISAGSGATPQQIWEYTTRTLTAGTNLPTVTQISEAVWHASTIGGMSDGAESMGYDLITATNTIKAKTDNLPADPADDSDIDAQLAAIKAETALIVEDTGTTIPATLANLALEATLTAIKGDGWTNQTLVKIITDISNISAGSGATPQQVWEYAARTLTAGTNIDLSALATAAKLDIVNENVVNVDGKADAAAILLGLIKAKTDNLPADPADDSDIDAQLAAIKAETAAILVDTGTTLDTNITAILADTNELQTDLVNGGRLDLLIDSIITHLTDIKGAGWTEDSLLAINNIAKDTANYAAAIKTKTDQLTFTVANKVDATATTDSSIAGDIWSYAKRTLTHPSVSAEEPEDSNTLILYRDADIAIELTDLTIPAGAKKYIFTIKDNLDSGDDQAVLQASYAIDGSEVETNTLVYINSAAAPGAYKPCYIYAY